MDATDNDAAAAKGGFDDDGEAKKEETPSLECKGNAVEEFLLGGGQSLEKEPAVEANSLQEDELAKIVFALDAIAVVATLKVELDDEGRIMGEALLTAA